MPTYPNSYQQPMMNVSNPYMDRFNQLQQFQQNLQGGNQNLQMLGKIVESEDIVKATDIPMDGNMYYFPKADGSMIFGKQWLANGTTRLIAFKPILDEEVNNLSQSEIKTEIGAFNDVLDTIQNDLRMLNDKIDKLSQPATTSKSKKGAENE